ncbi:MAG: hypothetical protein WCD76_14180 [Pyrinomonadaceae bacterium]
MPENIVSKKVGRTTRANLLAQLKATLAEVGNVLARVNDSALLNSSVGCW